VYAPRLKRWGGLVTLTAGIGSANACPKTLCKAPQRGAYSRTNGLRYHRSEAQSNPESLPYERQAPAAHQLVEAGVQCRLFASHQPSSRQWRFLPSPLEATREFETHHRYVSIRTQSFVWSACPGKYSTCCRRSAAGAEERCDPQPRLPAIGRIGKAPRLIAIVTDAAALTHAQRDLRWR
jgi:hypothetical protein